MSLLGAGLMQAVTAAAGQALNDVGGLRLTRLTAPVNVGDTSFNVERSFGLPLTGRIAVDGIPYFYRENSNGTLSGIYFTHGGLPVQGAAAAHQVGSQVSDLSGTYSAIDQANGALFVGTADGDDLSALGRNLGVPRDPSLEDDDQYRRLIEVLAYNPRGTLLGLRLVLNSLVGAGNYTIEEDPLTAPCQVFITVPGALFLNAVSQGKAYLESPVEAVASSNSVTTPSSDIFASSVRAIDENVYTICQTQLPDAALPGFWQLALQSAGATSNVSLQIAFGQNCGTATDFRQTPGNYHHAGSIVPASTSRLQCRVAFDLDGSLSSSESRGFGGRISDGQRDIAWGCIQQGESPTGQLGLITTANGNFIGGNSTSISLGQFYDVQILKNGTGTQSLLLDGQLVQTANYTDLSTSTRYGADLGALTSVSTPHVQMLNLGFSSVMDQEYLNLVPTGTLTASIASSQPQTIAFSQSVLEPTDTGKYLRISNSAAANSQGGNNNGTYAVNYVDANHATLTSQSGQAQVSSNFPQRITLSIPNVLTFPDSLGMQIQIGPSTQGNGGTYTIIRLLDPALNTDFASFQTSKPRTTNICEVQNASFVNEQNVGFALLPELATEQNVTFELFDVGLHTTASGGNLSLSPRAPVVLPSIPVAIRTANVRTGQVFDTHTPFVTINADGTYSAAPFYVSDAVFFVENYLAGVVAAGVRLNFSFS